MAQEKDTPMPSSADRSHVIRTSQQWESAIDKYSVIPWGVLCLELTPDGKTKAKVGEGNKFYSQLPYISDEIDLSKYYTKDEVDLIIENLEFMSIKETVPYASRNALPRTGNKLGDVRFVKNLANPGDDPLMYIWNGTKWVFSGGSIIDIDLSEYAKKSEVYPRLQQLEALSHAHRNKDILDQTSAVYTVEKDEKLASLKNYDVFVPATATTDGEEGLVPAPLAGEQAKFLRGDGIWAKVKTGDKYRAGDGITILSGEVISDTFPFQVLPQAEQVTQYIIYGAPGGVGDAVTGGYRIQINASAEGHTDRSATVIIPDKMYEGDYVDYKKQVYSTYRTNVTSRVSADPNYNYGWGIYSDGRVAKKDPGAYGGYPRVTALFELEPGASYEITAYNSYDDWKFENGMHINLYDADLNVTRTIAQSSTGNTTFTPAPTDKYMRFAYREDIWSWTSYERQKVWQLKDIERPCGLPELFLYPGIVNTINATTTVKPSLMYIEIEPPDDPESEDPMSEFTGIIYNDGVLDVTQDDPDNLNIITFHYRDNVTKDITVNTGIDECVVNITQEDPDNLNDLTISYADGTSTVINIPGGGTTYAAGQGIEIKTNTVTTYEDLHFDYYAFKDKIQGVLNGSISFDTSNHALTMTATNNYCYIHPYKESDGQLYKIPVEPNEDYLLTWEVNDTTIAGKVDVFENGDVTVGHYNPAERESAAGQQFLFTTSSTAETIHIRPYIYDAGTSLTFSNFQLYHVIYDTSGKIINAKLGAGLTFDSNNAIEAIPYTLPTASTSTLGGVIVGGGLEIDEDGVLSAPGGRTYVEGDGIEFTSDPRSAELPNTYQQIEYLQGTGTQGIILNYTPMSTTPADIKYELTYSDLVSEPTGWHYLIGGWLQSSHKMPPSIIYSNDNYQDKLVLSICEADIITNGDWPTGNTVHTSIVTIDGSTAKMQLDNGTESSGTWSGSIDHAPAIFASNRGSGTLGSFSAYKFRELKIYENGILIHHYYPCYRKSDNEPGIYDIIANRFLTNNGTGDFICGNDVNYDDTFINAKLGDGLSFDNNDAIQANVMTGADGTNAGTAGIVPAPTATDNTKFLKGDGTWSTISGGASYIEGKGIEFINTTEVDMNFDYAAFVNSLTGAYNGTLTKNVDDSITITPSSASGSWTVPDISGGSSSPYTFNVAPETTYKLTWDSGNDAVNGSARVFENAALTTMYVAPQSEHKLTFTTSNSCSYISIRFEETDSLPMTISNVKLYRLDPSSDVSINAKLGNGLSFDNNDAISVDEMTGATTLANGTSGTVPAPLAGDDAKFLRGDGSWAEIETPATYVEGDAIEFGHPGMTDLGFDFDKFVSKFTEPNNGIVSVDSANKAFTLTATGSDCYTSPWTGGSLYTIPVIGGRKYRLTWDSNAPNVSGSIFAFENADTSHMHSMNQSVQNYLEFTADTNSNVNFRFGVRNSGDSIRYSNIKFYEVDNGDPNTNIINVKYGDGLSLDNNNALQVNAGDCLEIDANNDINVDISRTTIFFNNNPNS